MRRPALLVPALLVVGLLAGCEQSSAPPSAEPDCDPRGSRPECYDTPDIGAYCAVVQVRDQYAAGRFEASELPQWADPSLRAGAPVVYDLAAASRPFSGGEVRDRLRSWQVAQGLPSDEGPVTRCVRRSTHEDVEALFGPPRAD